MAYYARTLYDVGHAVTLMKFAHDDLWKAITVDAFFESHESKEIRTAMAEKADDIVKHVDLKKINQNLDL